MASNQPRWPMEFLQNCTFSVGQYRKKEACRESLGYILLLSYSPYLIAVALKYFVGELYKVTTPITSHNVSWSILSQNRCYKLLTALNESSF